MTLSQRIQTASADETRALLEEAYEAVHGKSCDWLFWYGEIEQKHEARAFDNMLNAEAYLDAAMMLLPEGCGWRLSHEDELCLATIPGNGWPHQAIRVYHAPPALAILSAICMARGL